MSSAALETRVATLEAALGLPDERSPGLAVEALQARVDALEKERVKQAYRIGHLVRAYELKSKELEALRSSAPSKASN